MKKLLHFLIFLLFISNITNAQLTHIDTSFKVGTGASNVINKINIQSTGKIILSGDFQTFNGTSNKRIVRLLPNGTVDNTFTSGLGVEGPVRASALQSNDKLIIGGLFNSYNTTSIKNLARINNDGTIDNTFNTGIGPNNEVFELFLQKDGKILLAGFFSKYNNVNYNGFVRLNSDGTIDTNFLIGAGTNLAPDCFAQQQNNKLLIGGPFLRYKGLNVNKLIRIDLDGNIDTAFNTGLISGNVNEILVLPDDRIIIAGTFSSINGKPANRIARLLSNGSLDTTFNANFSSRIRAMHLQKDGKIILVGDFTTVNSQTVQRLVRLNTDGSIDNTVYVGTNGSIYDVAEQQDQNVIIAGNFTQTTQVGTPNTNNSNKIVRIKNSYNITPPCISATAPKTDADSITFLCKPSLLTVSVIAGQLNSGSTWFWYKDSLNGTFIDSGLSINILPQISTTYYVTAGLTCNDTIKKYDSFSVIVSDTMSKTVYIGSASIGADEGNAISYQWYRCDSGMQMLLGDTGRYYTPMNTGNYAVVMTNFFGCVDTSYCVNYVTGTVSVNNVKKLNIINPVNHKILLPSHINFKEIEIISSLGQKVFSLTGIQNELQIDVSILKPGLYYLRAMDDKKQAYFEKILVLNE
jgi:uncharacterized delta-60 repeat protein